MAKKSATTRLEVARVAQTALTGEIAELEARRNSALLADDDKTAAKILGEIEARRALAQGYADKVDLLAAEVERERAADVVRRHRVLIDRFKKTLGEADETAAKVAEHFAAGWEAISKAIDLRERARAAFSVRSPHARAAAESVEGAALGAPAVITLLEYEFYRISARPLVGGTPGARSRPSLPGAKPPNMQVILQPDRITPLVDKLRAASKFAVETLKAEVGSGGEAAAPEPTPTPLSSIPAANGSTDEQRELTPEQVAYSDLLRQMTEAANDTSDAGEQKYLALAAQIGAAEAAAKASLERTA
jgi:hypothetical protein